MEAFSGEAKAKRHFHRDRIGKIGEMPVIIATQQPALCLRHFKNRGIGGHAQISAFH